MSVMSSFIFFKVLVKKDVEPASTVDEHLVEYGTRDYWFQDKWKMSWLREVCPLIHTGEDDGYLRPP
jgi:hypothetical protein